MSLSQVTILEYELVVNKNLYHNNLITENQYLALNKLLQEKITNIKSKRNWTNYALIQSTRRTLKRKNNFPITIKGNLLC